MLKIPRTILFAAVLAFQSHAAVILYMNGDYSSIEYHLGVLSEMERFQVPIDTVVGSEWGAFAGALWSAGWSSAQIRELLKSWDSLPKSEPAQKAALWQKEWLIKHKEDGSPLLVELGERRPYFGQVFFDLRIQEALWRSDIGSKIPFRKIDSLESYPFPLPSSENEESIRILSTAIALRDTNGTATQRYQLKLWQEDTTLLILRPHSKPNPDSLFEAGTQAVQARRSKLAQVALSMGAPTRAPTAATGVPPPRFLYLPVFDSVPAEIQGHLKSFWNPKDTGILGVRNFLENLQNDGSYREVNLVLDSGSFLQINSESYPQLSLALIGFGGTIFGANVAANTNFRFVNQFGYNLNLIAFYGQGKRGAEPYLRFEQFFMGDGDFFAKAKFYEYEPIPFFQNSIYRDARLLKERARGMVLGVEKDRLQIAVEIENRNITSGASAYPVYDIDDIFDEDREPKPIYFIYEPVGVSSIFPYAKWLWQSEDYNRWFAKNGFMAQLTGGFKAVSVHSSDQEAPLYVSSQGILWVTHPLNEYVSVSAGTEFGANFRRTDGGAYALPSELHGVYIFDPDPALDNRYRFAMGMGSYMESWQIPGNSSHLYGLAGAGFSVQWQGSGIFWAGGFAKDGEPNPWSDMEAKRLFSEPKIRIKTGTFDFVLGYNQIYSMGNNYVVITKKGEKRFFLSLQSDFFN